MTNQSATLVERTASTTRKSRWPGWIWAVPLAALGIVAWLMVREFSSRGFDVTVSFDDVSGLKAKNTKVSYRGVEVGEVTQVALSSDRGHVEVHLSIHEALKPQVTTGTRFYLEGATPSLSDLSSLKAIVAGPTLVMVPGSGNPQRHFTGIAGKPLPSLAVSIPYLATFTGEVGDLKPGAPVILRGFSVGEVASTELTTDGKTGSLGTAVVLLLDPTRFHIQDVPRVPDWTAVMNATLAKLVDQHLRARLTQSPPLVGRSQIELDTLLDAAPAKLASREGYLEIPTVEGGGITDFTQKLGQLPIKKIGENVRSITDHIQQLTSSPQLKDSIAHLDLALADVDKTMQKVEPQLGPTLDSVHQAVDSLRRAASEIEATTASAQKVIGANPTSPDGNLEQTLRELEGAARSIRALANYLDQHPEALIKGRPGEEPLR
jgi:paraquat-inducible protein B